MNLLDILYDLLDSLIQTIYDIIFLKTVEPNTKDKSLDIDKNDENSDDSSENDEDEYIDASDKLTFASKSDESDDDLSSSSEDSDTSEFSQSKSSTANSMKTKPSVVDIPSINVGKSPESLGKAVSSAAPINVNNFRTALPSQMHAAQFPSFPQLIRGSLHVTCMQPLSIIQTICEEMEENMMLIEACKEPVPIKRMEKVIGFAVSSYVYTHQRTRRPFLAQPCETFDMDRMTDEGWCFHAEQICNTPDISAAYAEGTQGWSWWTSTDLSLKNYFSNPSPYIQMKGIGTTGITLNRYNETYEYNKWSSRLEGIVKESTRKIVHFGTLTIKCSNGYSANIHLDKESGIYKGSITDSNHVRLKEIDGTWFGACKIGGNVVFTPKTRNPIQELYYGMSPFAMRLNELTKEKKKSIFKTDSRLRKDMRYLEKGNIKRANQKKESIEKRTKWIKKYIGPITPQWFAQNSKGQWVTKGTYWSIKRDIKNYKSPLPDLW